MITRDELKIGDRICAVYRTGRPEVLLLQPVDGREETPDREAQYLLRETDAPFALCAFPVEDWDRDLSPWSAPAVFGAAPFGGCGSRTLEYVSGRLLAGLRAEYGAGLQAVMGGYSLAGLFALWCGYETDLFAAVAAASPSVWFDGWTAYAGARAMGAGAVYLSLGDREEKTRHERLARVGDCVREQKRLLDGAGVPNTLVWEPGNHFQNATERTARGFLWALERLRRP